MRKYLSLVFILIGCTRHAFSQGASQDGIRSTNVLPAEAYTFKFNSAGSVDYHGDYSASIPLMTVPGRGGLDYSISANYKSGITTDQRATWVGLGWNVNPGSVTRVVNGLPDNVKGLVQYNGILENGAIVDYPPKSGTTGFNFPKPDYLDYYLVNIPGVISGLVVPVNGNDDSIPDYTFQEYNGFQIGMDMVQQGSSYEFGTAFNRVLPSPCSTSTTTLYKDAGFIWVRDPNGTYYVFGLPLRSEIVWHDPPVQNFEPRFIIEYVSSWQLTAIISHDATYNYNGGNLNPNENSGSWVRFEYNYPYPLDSVAVRNIRPLHFDRSNQTQKDPYGLLTQTTYLSKIITPTHEAVFETSPRNDISFLSPYNSSYSTLTGVIGDYTGSANGTTGTFIRPLRLDNIILKHRFPASNISFVRFNYAPFGDELCRYNPSFGVSTGSGTINVQNMGKTTLKEIMIADAQSGYSYRFKYTDQIDGFNPYYIADWNTHTTLVPPIQANEIYSGSGYTFENGYYRTRSGRMGYLYATSGELNTASPTIKNTKAAAAWSIRTLEYPTGVIDTISYELDQFDLYADSAASGRPIWLIEIHNGDTTYTNINFNEPLWVRFATDEAGIRVNYISSYDSLTQSSRKIRYNYPVGHLPGLPLNYLRNKDPYLGADVVRSFMFGYSSSEVEYQSMIVTNPDSTKIKTSYSNVRSGDFYDFQTAQSTCFLTIDRGAARGKILSVEYFDALGRLSMRKGNNVYIFKKYSGYAPHDLLLAMDPTQWSYYSGGRRLLESYSIRTLSDTTSQYETDVTAGASARKALVTYTGYLYNEKQQLISQNVIDGMWRVYTDFKYVYESTLPYAGAFSDKNRLSDLAYKKIYWRSLNNQQTIPKTEIDYSYGFLGGSYRTDSVKVWENRNQDNTLTADEMKLQTAVLSYDIYGNPLSIVDGNGVISNFEWSSNYKNSRLTKRILDVNGTAFSRSYTYNPLYLVSTETDENNNVTSYQYDGHGRLLKVIGPSNITLKENSYNFKNQINNPALPLLWQGN